VCSVDPAGLVSLLATGLCSIDASQPGDNTFAAATTVQRSFAVTSALLAQAISFPPFTVGPSITLAASSDSGLAVVFSSLTPTVCTVSGNSVGVLATGLCSIAADQPGNGIFAAATRVVQSASVTAGGGADIPTLPEWAAILMAMLLLGLGLRRQQRQDR
jgi:hypothetical protein